MSTDSNPDSRPGSRPSSRPPHRTVERERSISTHRSSISGDSADAKGPPRPLCEERQSRLHGRGMFTTEKVSKGKLIFSETPLVYFDAQNIPWADVWKAYLNLEEPNQAAWRSLSKVDTLSVQQWLALSANEKEYPGLCGEVLAKYWNNSWKDQVCGISLLGNRASFFNHSCRPTAVWTLNAEARTFEVRATEDLDSDQEVLLNYVPLGWPRVRRLNSLRPFGFECSCALCAAPNSETEQNRAAIDQVDRQLRSMSFPGDKRVRIEMYIEMLHLQQSEPAMVWDALWTYVDLSRCLYRHNRC